MKRLFVLLLVACLAVPFLGASAGSLDLKALDDVELVALLDAVRAERLSRLSFSSFVLQPGEYRVGVDVPAGAYRAVIGDGFDGASFAMVDADGYDTGSFILGKYLLSVYPGEVGRVVLLDSEVLHVKTGPVSFFVETGGVTFK